MKNQTISSLNKQRFWKGGLLVCILAIMPILSFSQYLELEQARQLAITRQHQAAETELAKLVEVYPGFLPAQLLRAHNHSWWRKFDLAILGFKGILDKYPDNEEALIGLGYAYSWSGDTPKAIYPFQKVLQKKRDSKEARQGLGHTYLIAGNGEAALMVFQELSEEFPDEPDHNIGKGQAHLLLDESKSARIAFRKALELDPSNRIAQDMLDRTRTESSAIELDAWGGYSKVGGDSRYGLRFLQASWQFDPRFTAYVRYDNSLSLDNIDFLARRQGAAASWIGAFAGWNRHLASRFDYGLRFFPDRNVQQLFKAEQVFYTSNAINFKLGGFMGIASDRPTEWFVNMGFHVPVGKIFSFETSYFYARDGNSNAAQHRGLLSGKIRHPKGYELTVGGFYGKPNLNAENFPGVNDRIAGGYLVALFPFSKIVWGQFAINREQGVFNNATVFALGLKIRFEK